MAYYTPDLTGTNPAYQISNDRYEIFNASQRIVFDTPVYLDSLAITVNGTLIAPFVKDTDWTINSNTDIDYTSESKMMVLQPSFSATLITGFEIISAMAPPYQISCTYQKLWPVPSKVVVNASGSVELTPDLIISMLSRLGLLEAQVQEVPNVNALGTGNPILLPLDQNKTISTNSVSAQYTVNTFNSQNIIQPTCGPFFADSLVITRPSGIGHGGGGGGNVIALVNGTDYTIIGLDAAKTKSSANTGGVNRLILINTPFAGVLTVTCHAYGGDVTLYDMTAVYAMVQNINTFLGTSNVLTPDLLGESAPFVSILSRVTALETNLRNLINTGTPNYSDVTGNGTAVVQKIRSVDTNLHWWTIASLYQVSGSQQVIIADRMHFRMQLLAANLMADVFIDVNTSLPDPFNVDSTAVSQNLEYVPFTSYGIGPVCMPQFRALWVTGGSSASGVLLQIGLELPGLSESLSIQDLSGNQSAWLLTPSSGTTAILPNDTMVALPNTAYTWDTTISGSVSYIHMMPNKHGYLVWGGALPLASMNSTPSTLTPLIDGSFNVADITRVRLQFTMGDAITVITADAIMSSLTAGTMTGQVYVQNEAIDGTEMLMQVKVINTGSAITVTVVPSRFPSTSTLSLRHVLFMTN